MYYRRIYSLSAAGVLSAAVAVLSVSCKSKKETTRAQKHEIVESVYASATVKAESQYAAYAPFSGLIREVLIDEGQTVQEGQVIAKIQNNSLTYVADNAKTGLQQAQNNLGSLDEVRAQLASAKKQLNLDSANLVRQKELWNQNIGTLNQLEARQLAYEVSKNNVTALETRYKQTAKQLNNAVSQAKNQVGNAGSNLADLEIKSKVSGTVYAMNLKAGEMASPQFPIAIIGKTGTYYLEMEVDETDVTRIELGQLVVVSFDAYHDKVFTARVSKVSPNMNAKTQTFIVEAIFTETPPKLYPGLSAEASIVIQKKKDVLVIPLSYLKDADKVVTEKGELKVTTGIRNLEMVEITSGLSENTLLIKP